MIDLDAVSDRIDALWFIEEVTLGMKALATPQ